MATQKSVDSEIRNIFTHLSLIAAAIEQICDDVLSPRLSMGKVMEYRYLYLNVYLWRGYLGRLCNDSKYRDFAKRLLREFSQNIYPDTTAITRLRNMACHYEKECSMDLSLSLAGGEICPMPYLPPYKIIKRFFNKWYIEINTEISKFN